MNIPQKAMAYVSNGHYATAATETSQNSRQDIDKHRGPQKYLYM